MVISKFLNSPDKRRLFSNFISLSVLQGANYILPFITLPYLVRVLGPEKYGLIAFAQAFIQYFNILTDYGFNLSATREISIHREDKEKVSEIFSSVMIIKFVFLILSFLIMSIIVFSFEKFRKDWGIYFLTFGMVIGQVLFPVWFFQGMERMKYITFLNITAKLIFTVSIFIFIHKASDYIYVPLLNSLGFIVAGIMALWIVFRDFEVDFRFPSLEALKHQLKEGWYIFISQVSVSLFNNTNIVILGLFTNNTAVGYYSIAEKLMRALAMLQTPITNAIFPHISYLIKRDKMSAMLKLKKIMKVSIPIYSALLLFIIIYSDHILPFLFGKEAMNSVIIFKIIGFIPLAIFLNNIFGTQIMLNTGKSKEFFKVLLWGAILNIFLCSILSYYFSYIGTAIALLLVELWIMIGMFYYAKGELK
jgi:PST family polysaccharide transporter